ncbi:hypothetical protein OF83DRAFT_1051085 [Amylostereum chailletii]|nr:hypothetical protein OF83DRAFT_1051085 [Amylostereum chailletii]
MPPMTLNGIVSKCGFMNKTATVTVSRWVVHDKTGKVQLRLDDAVVIRNCPPVSARKRFALDRVLRSPERERAQAHAALAAAATQTQTVAA